VSRFRTLVIGGALAVLATSAIGAPVGAADTKGTLAIVNGIPGRVVDVCLNGNEIKSNLRYAKALLKNVVNTGNKVLKFYAADPRECRGNVLAQASFPLAAGGDLTIVATKNGPDKVVTFSNAGLGEIPPAGAPLAFGIVVFRTAADVISSIKVRYWTPVIPETPVTPSVDPIWSKGDQFAANGGVETIWKARATRPDDPDTLAQKTATSNASHRYEWILVGSNAGNARFVFLDRIVSNVSP
jgi:hypothetical protein